MATTALAGLGRLIGRKVPILPNSNLAAGPFRPRRWALAAVARNHLVTKIQISKGNLPRIM
jgi:hypothetical protein